MTYLWVAISGALGCLTRLVLSQVLNPKIGIGATQGVEGGPQSLWPWGTFLVNLVGSFLAGILLMAFHSGSVSGQVRTALGVGFLGGFTTFSSFSVEALELWERGHHALSLSYVFLSVLTGLILCGLGLWVGRQVWAHS